MKQLAILAILVFVASIPSAFAAMDDEFMITKDNLPIAKYFEYLQQKNNNQLTWESDYGVGILEHKDPILQTTISDYDENSLEVKWEKFHTTKRLLGYDILKKSMNDDYVHKITYTDKKILRYVDYDLPIGFYSYIVIPVIDDSPEYVPQNGITRNHELFNDHILAEQSEAEILLIQECPLCGDTEFSEINDIFTLDIPLNHDRNSEEFQQNLLSEIHRAENIIKDFEIKNNF